MQYSTSQIHASGHEYSNVNPHLSEPYMPEIFEVIKHDQASGTATDSEWDEFLAKVPGTHYKQTSSWGRINSFKNWRIHRVLALEGNQIVGGVQMMSDLSVPGAHVAYVLDGPIYYEVGNEYTKAALLKRLIKLAKDLTIHVLLLQPATTHSISVNELIRFGFEPSRECFEPKATVLLDLAPDLETILRGMKPRTRANIRRSGRGKLVVMEGSNAHLPIYYELLEATAERGSFTAPPFEVIERILATWVPKETVRLFIAKYQEEFVAGQIAIACGDTAVNLLSVWSGSCGKEKPNDAIQWRTIEWAKRNGYRWYDLNGIDEDSAESVLFSRGQGDVIAKSFSKFKLGYGGRIVLRPGLFRLNLCSKWQRTVADVSNWVFRRRCSLRY